jgi:hypothetical protein
MIDKELYRLKLLEYCGNPGDTIPNRTEMPVSVLGLKSRASLYKHFFTDEISEIVAEALKIRRTK